MESVIQRLSQMEIQAGTVLALRMVCHLQDREPWKEGGGLSAILAGALWCGCRAALPEAVMATDRHMLGQGAHKHTHPCGL